MLIPLCGFNGETEFNLPEIVQFPFITVQVLM